MRLLALLLCSAAILSGCSLFRPAKTNIEVGQPFLDKELFILTSAPRQLYPEKSSILTILMLDSNNTRTQLSTLEIAPESWIRSFNIINDSIALIHSSDRNSEHTILKHFNFRTGTTDSIAQLPYLRDILVSAKKNFVLMQQYNRDFKTCDLYSYANGRIMLLKSFKSIEFDNSHPLPDNNYLVVQSDDSDWNALSQYCILNTSTLTLDTLPFERRPVRQIETTPTSILYTSPSSHPHDVIYEYSIDKRQAVLRVDSLNIQQFVRLPNSPYILVKASTVQEYSKRSWEIMREIFKAHEEDPSIVCILPADPEGYWRVIGDHPSGRIRDIDNTLDYGMTTTSGRHILVRDEEDGLSVMRVSDVIDTQ